MAPIYGVLYDINMSHYGAAAIISMYVNTYISIIHSNLCI